jgi:very-short-patch-repair endonuclease/DNA-directed RNA polymerase subunit RPC12/RpoP
MAKNLLLKDNKELMEEWSYELNKNIDIENLEINSNKKVWWKCSKCGYEWQQTIRRKAEGRKCLVCSNLKVLKGYNDLATTNPELADDWDYEKNYPLTPDSVVAGSGKRVWWKCSKCGNEWETTIVKRKNGHRCAKCTGRKVVTGYNDLATKQPLLVKEWDYTKNKEKPDMMSPYSKEKVWWKCSKCGNEWRQSPAVRTNGCGCPFCAGQKIKVGFNDLATTNPRLAKEWNYEKNKCGPETVMEHTNKKTWWKCEKGHEWEASINSRGSGVNCPICSREFKTSFPEKAIFYYISKVYIDALENYRDDSIDNKEIDIYIPSKKIGIEYDGDHWHVDDERDIEKDIICKKKGIKLFRIREPKCKKLKTSICIKLKNRTLVELESKIKYLINDFLGKKLDIDLENEKNKIYELMNYQERTNSLSQKVPHLIEEWDYEKNYPLLPTQVSFGSNKKVWWICSNCGYSWATKVNHRYNGSNCPRCHPNSIEIEQYDLNMNLLKRYHSIASAERETGIRHIKENLSGGRKSAGGFIWKYKDEKKVKKELSKQTYHNSKKIIQYDLNMKKIKEYNSIAEAERENKISHIKDVLSGKRKTAGGCLWKYKEDVNESGNN